METARDFAHDAPHRRVLVADDSASFRQLMAATLSRTFSVVQVADGNEALNKLDEDGAFDCIVTDDWMPGCSGVDIAEYVRATPALKGTPVIIVTAGSSSPTKRQVEGHRSGAAFFLNKPFSPDSLHRLVTMVVHARTAKKIA